MTDVLQAIGAPEHLSEVRRRSVLAAIARAESVQEVVIPAYLGTDGSYPGAELLRQFDIEFTEVLFAQKVGRNADHAGAWDIRIVYTT
jgi:hypothetical protein